MSRFSIYTLILVVAAGAVATVGTIHPQFARADPPEEAYDLPGIPPGGRRLLPPPPDAPQNEAFISAVELVEVD